MAADKKIVPIRPKWQGTMTDRERFNNQMHYKEVDRCFNMEFGYWRENFKLWPLFIDNNITSNEESSANFDPLLQQEMLQLIFHHEAMKEKKVLSL